ncbi:mediator of RNA polymerase II transcription subunit 15a isoform X2 [Neltuma alba]|uniref:mediator of RNA polymerase II transcription subunit 15a isoform X2 n=1 Tax=Neltuma alba TaxID=207710 RepID=UPI0010A367EF|nr:mediator of RNA polymerase II transcription subunit 15a-like isoform X2 [Prosopis alba]
MDANWRSTQGTESTMDTSDWRAQLQPDSRQRIVNKIMDTLKRHLPVSGQDGLHELRKIAQRFEEKIYTAATSQSDYLRKISLKMLTMENKTQNTMVNPLQSNAGGPSNKPMDSGIPMQSQVHNPGQSHAIPLPNQSQPRQQLLSQNIQNNIAPPASNIGQTPIQNVVGPNSNMQNNMFGGSQRQMPPRQQVVPQQQQQSQNSQPYLYQKQQLQQQFTSHKLQPGNIQHSLMQSHIQQQPNLQSNQLQSSQPSVMQTSSVMQPSITQTSLSSLQQNQQANNAQQSTQPMLQQHSQSVIRQQQQQTSIMNQQQTPITQQPILPPQQQQQQQLLAQQSNVTSMQHPQLLGQQNNAGDMQQHQRLLGQQNNLPNLQQRQQQQQLINQQNNLSNTHQQQLGSNVSGLQQQQLLANQSGNPGMQTGQHAAPMLQQSKVPVQQQSQQNVTNLLQSQGQQSQSQPPQQQLMPQIQSQPAQLQQQQPNPLQRDMQQRLQAPSSLLQQQNVLDQQKQLYQSQRTLPDSSSNSTAQTGKSGADDWQEEVYQGIKSMRELYLPELSEMYQKIAAKLPQHEALSRQPKSDQLEKLKMFKVMLERIIAFLQIPKANIVPGIKEKMALYEKQAINFISSNRPRKAMSSMQQGQLPPPHMHPVSQPQSQLTQVQSHENQINSQMQPTNLQSSAVTMPQNNMASLQHNSIPSTSGLSTTQQNMINSMQPGTNLDSSSVNSLQHVGVSTLQQNSVSAPPQTNISSLSSQGGGSVLQQNPNPVQPASSILQHQQLKQPQEPQMLQNQQFKHIQQRPLLQRQQLLQHQQQLQQVTKQQVPAHMQTHQMPPLHQINDMNDVKMRQVVGVKQGTFQQHLPSGQRSAYPHQQFKSGGSFAVSSPHLLQAASPQIPQHSSPQVDQQNLPSLTKVSTPLQSANSPFVGPTPSPPLAPSPMLGDSEKPISVVSSVSNAANIGHQQTGTAMVPAQSLAIGTPGISPSPLLAEFSGPDGAHGNALAAPSTKLTDADAEQPIERLIKAVKSMSSKDLTAAVSDIGSVVSMIDRIAGSAPGNGSRAAVGEDLVAMTKCRLQARNFINQDGNNGTKRMRRYVNAMPLNVVSSPDCMNDSMKQLNALEVADLGSATTASIKKPRIKANHALLEEIREINQRLIDTVVDISDEDVDPTAAAAAAADGSEGTIVKCCFNAVALSSSLKSQYASAQMVGPQTLLLQFSNSPIQPLRLLVPTNYPHCSPILLDKFPVESRGQKEKRKPFASKENEDLSVKTKSRFSNSLRGLPEPMSLGEIARTWDVCARAIISEYAQESGGGSFSSKYGTWENWLSAA